MTKAGLAAPLVVGARSLTHDESGDDERDNATRKQSHDNYLSLSEEWLGFFAVWNRDFAIVLDHANHIVVQLPDIGRHRFFIRELFAVNDEPFLYRASETGSPPS